MNYPIIEAILLAVALSMDAFFASFSYGNSRIHIPWRSVLIINGICAALLGVALWAGTLVQTLVPVGLTQKICFVILLLLGLGKLLDSATKSLIRRFGALHSNWRFSLFQFRFVLSIYADPEEADADHSKIISPMEAASLAVALSLDGMAVGFGAALGQVNGWAVLLAALVTDALAVMGGAWLGEKAAKKLPFNLSWFSGVLLILMAISKL